MKRVSGLSLIQKREGAMRESGIELLRIILMLQVVFLHICDYGEYSVYPPDKGGVDCLVYWIMMFMSRTTVYVYIALTGYFSVSSKSNQSLRSVLQNLSADAVFFYYYSAYHVEHGAGGVFAFRPYQRIFAGAVENLVFYDPLYHCADFKPVCKPLYQQSVKERVHGADSDTLLHLLYLGYAGKSAADRRGY